MMDAMTVKRTATRAPGEWSKAKVSQIASIITGPFGTLLKASEYGGAEGVPLISVGEIREGFLRVTDETPTVSEIVTKRLPQYLLREGDIVFGRKGGVERSAIINRHQVGWFLGSDGISIRLKEGFHRSFFGHAFRSNTVQSWLLQNASGTTMPSLNQAILGAVEIPFPEDPLEQEAIAEALSDADALIEGLERLIAKKRLIKQGAMQDLLTAKRRLPGFSGEWQTKRLSEIGQVKTGLTYSPKNVSSYGTLVLRSSNIQEDRLAFLDNVYVDVDVSDEATVRTGDLLICVRNGSRQLIGKTAMIDERADGMAFGAFMSAYRSDLNDYLIWCFQSSVIQKQVSEHLGATINQITNKTLKGIEVPIPAHEEERTAIAGVLADMDHEIQALDTRLEKARQVKEGMMQNLLTGRIRLV